MKGKIFIMDRFEAADHEYALRFHIICALFEKKNTNKK